MDDPSPDFVRDFLGRLGDPTGLDKSKRLSSVRQFDKCIDCK
jgi:hypothetical protein